MDGSVSMRGWVPAHRVARRLGMAHFWRADTLVDATTVSSWRDVVRLADATGAGGSRPVRTAAAVGTRPGIVFDGIDDVLTVAHATTLEPGTAFTVGAVIQGAAYAADASVAGKWSAIAANSVWLLQAAAGGATSSGASSMSETGTHTTRFSVRNWSTVANDESDTSSSAPRVVLLHWDGSTITHYTSRVAGAGTACAGAKSVPGTTLTFGCAYAGTAPFAGAIGEIAVWTRALTAAERVWYWAAATRHYGSP